MSRFITYACTLVTPFCLIFYTLVAIYIRLTFSNTDLIIQFLSINIWNSLKCHIIVLVAIWKNVCSANDLLNRSYKVNCAWPTPQRECARCRRPRITDIYF